MVRSRSVSMETATVMPARNGYPFGGCSTSRRTGIRWTTFTQLPVAFWGGSTENSAPVAGAIASTVAGHSTPG